MRAPNNAWGGIRARTFIHNGTGDGTGSYLYLSTYFKNDATTKARYIVGSGGFTFGDTQANTAARYYYIAFDNKIKRVDHSRKVELVHARSVDVMV